MNMHGAGPLSAKGNTKPCARISTYPANGSMPGTRRYFADALTPKLLWRLFADFRECAAYLDIETTGLGGPYDHITTAALYDGRNVFHYVYGDNLDLFARDLGKYKILITYNGACFDLPFIRSYFGIAVDQVHIDLRYLLSSLGYRGGLKGCEKCLGLDRAELDGVDGYFAVLLWNEYRKSGNKKHWKHFSHITLPIPSTSKT